MRIWGSRKRGTRWISALCPLCGLVQITETVSPDRLFGDYLYFSSFSDTMVKHAEDLAESLDRQRRLGAASLVVEVASNDGYLLQHYANAGVPVLGIEPAANVARVARERGIPTDVEFFYADTGSPPRDEGVRARTCSTRTTSSRMSPTSTGSSKESDGSCTRTESRSSKCPTCATCSSDASSTRSTTSISVIFRSPCCTGCSRAMGSRSATSIGCRSMAGRCGSVQSTRLMQSSMSPLRGCSTRRSSGARREPSPIWRFAARVAGIRRGLPEMLEGLKRGGFRIAAYGAAAKGSTLLNSLSLSPGLIEFVVDRSVYKQGRYMPGVHLPIYPTEKLMEARPDYVLLLTWNFAEEILAQQEPFRAQGGRFVLPIPEPTIL